MLPWTTGPRHSLFHSAVASCLSDLAWCNFMNQLLKLCAYAFTTPQIRSWPLPL
jgi:hypothetical protein